MQHKEALPIGTILDSGIRQYRIKSILGQGGFGITYLATSQVLVENIPFEVPFAIKEHYISSMNERQGTSVSISNVNNTEEIKESIDSFLVEAQRLNKLSLNHPGIVRVNENFRANGTAYYVMEYVKGKSLREHVKQSPLGRLPEAEALQLFRPVAETIGYLHKNHVTHLDIKPDNILIRENGEPVVIDFGLSKHYSSKGTPTSTIKAAGCSAGYSPMEQYVGITSFTPEADIYALGATLSYMLAGKDPMVSGEINSNIIRNSLPEEVSEQTADAIVKAMEKLKENRPHFITEMIDGMESHQYKKQKQNENSSQKENDYKKTKKIKASNVAGSLKILGSLFKFCFKKEFLLYAIILIPLTGFIIWRIAKTPANDANLKMADQVSGISTKPVSFYSEYSELKIGDYVYNDGTFSHELSKEKECSGIVFTLNTTPTEKKKGWTHGQIVALKDVGLFDWGEEGVDLPSPHNKDFDTAWDSEGIIKVLQADKDGYVYSNSKYVTNYGAFKAIKNFPVSLPSNSSGWYMPSIGQWSDILINLCECTIIRNGYNPVNLQGNEIKIAQLLNIKLNGNGYFTSSELTSYWVWEYNPESYGGQLGIGRKGMIGNVRAVAAF